MKSWPALKSAAAERGLFVGSDIADAEVSVIVESKDGTRFARLIFLRRRMSDALLERVIVATVTAAIEAIGQGLAGDVSAESRGG